MSKNSKKSKIRLLYTRNLNLFTSQILALSKIQWFQNNFQFSSGVDKVSHEISNIQSGCQLGLPHLGILCYILKKPIRIYDENGFTLFVCGDNDDDNALELIYSKPKGNSGHYRSKNRLRPLIESGKNNCLLDSVSIEAEISSNELRKLILKYVSNNWLMQREEIEFLKAYNSDQLLLGGVIKKYEGKNSEDAGKILDSSHGVAGHGDNALGHPRAHVSNPDAEETIDSVENFSKIRWRTGFFSKADQNEAAHEVLGTRETERAFSKLNAEKYRASFTISTAKRKWRFEMGRWENGRLTRRTLAKSLFILYKHRIGKFKDPENKAAPHIQTFYPVESERESESE